MQFFYAVSLTINLQEIDHGKLSKTLRKLGDDILERTRLKKIRIRLEGRHFLIERFINPWVLMAEGNLEEVVDKAGKSVGQENPIY